MRARANGTGQHGFLRLAVLLACAVVSSTAMAQAPPSGVFSEVPTAVVSRAGSALEPSTMRSRLVQVDTQKITAARRGRKILRLNLFDDEVVEVDIKRVRPTRTGYFISGKPRGKEWGDVRLAVNGPVVVGTVETPAGRFTIRSTGRGRHVIRQIDSAKEPFECQVITPEQSPIPGSPPEQAVSTIDAVLGQAAPPAIRASSGPTEDGSEVRVLIVYTPALQAEQGGAVGMQALIDLFMHSANQAFEEGGINPRLVLAHSAMVDYVAVHPVTDLERLRDSGDGHMDEVHTLRNLHAADLVHLLTDEPTAVRGVAYQMQREGLSFEDRGFALSATDDERVFTHEIGHNFGAAHDRYVAFAEPIYPYAYGYVNKSAFERDAPAESRWHTVMAYDDRCDDAGIDCEWLLRFANPDQVHEGDPLGVPADSPETGLNGPSDVRRTVNNTARWVGSFRSEACTEFRVSPETPVAPVGGGEIGINVETTAGCVWDSSTRSDFFSLTSASRLAGTDILRIQVEPNQTGAERSGTVTVAGQTIRVIQLAVDKGICGRTPDIVVDIMAAVAGTGGPDRCDEATAEDLSRISELRLRGRGIGSLKSGDFQGLTGLRNLFLHDNKLTEIPTGLFSGLSNLEILNLSRNALKDLPADLFHGLPKLRYLYVSNNQLTGLPRELFNNLSNLENLGLEVNQLTSLPAGLFDGLHKLDFLALHINQLSDLPSGLFDDLSNLAHLDLHSNRLASLPPGLFRDLSRVRRIYLRINRISELPPGIFRGLLALEELDLSDNEVAQLHEGTFDGLSTLEELWLGGNELTTLPSGAFAGLSNLQELNLSHNKFGELPEGAFAGLHNLETLVLLSSRIPELPSGLFDGLRRLKTLDLYANYLTGLPTGVFSDLGELETLFLGANELSSLSPDVFASLPALKLLSLAGNPFTGLPREIFAELGNLENLQLRRLELRRLPDGIFSGLTGLKTLNLNQNLVFPLPLTVSLEKVGSDQFRAIAPSGAPFALELPVSTSHGSLDATADSVTIPAGSTESPPVRVSRTDSAEEPVAVDLGTLPFRPPAHLGYELVKDDALPLRVLPSLLATDANLGGLAIAEGELEPAFDPAITRYTVIVGHATTTATLTHATSNPEAIVAILDANERALQDSDMSAGGHQVNLGEGENLIKIRVTSADGSANQLYELAITRDAVASVCLRTPKVRDVMMDLAGIDACDQVTAAYLSQITELDLRNSGITSLKSGDFNGLSGVERIWLEGNRLSSLPAGIFDGLLKLNDLQLGYNNLSSLSANVFSSLHGLESLNLRNNHLGTLPDGVFSGLTSLKFLSLSFNGLRRLDPGVFAGLSKLEELGLAKCSLNELPEDLFSDLVALEKLSLADNRISHLPDGIFSELGSLRELFLFRNWLSSLPPGVFSALGKLEHLSLQNNLLDHLPVGVFQGLPVLDELYVDHNRVDPLPLAVSLEKVSEGRFRAVAPPGAPFALEVGVGVSETGTISGNVASVTILAGATESAPVEVVRVDGTEDPVTVNITDLPDVPERHKGYFLQIDETLPRTILSGPRAPPPAQVTGVEVTAGMGWLGVSWTAVSDANGYRVQWKSGDLDYDESRQAVLAGSENTSHTIPDLDAGTEYTVRVIATKENADDGAPSEEVTGIPTAAPPARVTGVAVEPGIEELEASWEPVPDADGYKVQWKSGDEEYEESRQALLSGGDIVGFSITGLTPGIEYTVRVIATKAHADDGEPSEEATGIPRAMSPDQVMGVAVVAGVEQLAVSWEVVSGADGYKVQWKSGDEAYDDSRQEAIMDEAKTDRAVTGLTPGTEYTVRVIATREHADDGVPSEEATGIPMASPPAQVTGVAVALGIEELEVSWDAVSGTDGYKVQWKSGEEDYDESRQIVLSDGSSTSHSITNLTPGLEYAVRVIATKANADDGVPSDEVTGIPKAQPPAQVTGVVVAAGFEELQVSWDAVFDADGYKVQWKSGSQDYDEARQVALLGSETTNYTIIDLATGTEYTIRVIATKDHADDGEPSDEVTGTPASPDPDVNADGTLDGDDAQVMYQAYASAERVGDGESGGTPESRSTLLSGLAGTADPTDDDLKAMLRKANVWRSVGLAHGGDINEDGVIDGDDAFVMYYAYEFADLVGDGETGGTARHRRHLLASRAGKDNPTDADLKKMLRLANKLREDFG